MGGTGGEATAGGRGRVGGRRRGKGEGGVKIHRGRGARGRVSAAGGQTRGIGVRAGDVSV